MASESLKFQLDTVNIELKVAKNLSGYMMLISLESEKKLCIFRPGWLMLKPKLQTILTSMEKQRQAYWYWSMYEPINQVQEKNQFLRIVPSQKQSSLELSTVSRSNNSVFQLTLSKQDVEELIQRQNLISFHLGIIPADEVAKNTRLHISQMNSDRCYGCIQDKPSQDDHAQGCLADDELVIAFHLPHILSGTSFDFEETHRLIAQLNK